MPTPNLAFVPKIYFPGALYFGANGMQFLKTLEGTSAMIIVSKTAFGTLSAKLREFIGDAPVVMQSGEPTELHVNKIIQKARACKAECLVAIGGGSVIDPVKIAKSELAISMVAIPTTIGSGAEVSQYAPIIDSSSRVKKVASGQHLLPETVILNPGLLHTLRREQIIIQTLDAFSHGLESLVSKLSNPLSDSMAMYSLDLLYEELGDIAKNENVDIDILGRIQIAAAFAGLAQSSVATGLAHAFAHYLGGRYGIPHALLIAMVLPDVIDLNIKNGVSYDKLQRTHAFANRNLSEMISTLWEQLELTSPAVPVSDPLDVIADGIRKDVCALTNPYSASADDILKILQRHSTYDAIA